MKLKTFFHFPHQNNITDASRKSESRNPACLHDVFLVSAPRTCLSHHERILYAMSPSHSLRTRSSAYQGQKGLPSNSRPRKTSEWGGGCQQSVTHEVRRGRWSYEHFAFAATRRRRASDTKQCDQRSRQCTLRHCYPRKNRIGSQIII